MIACQIQILGHPLLFPLNRPTLRIDFLCDREGTTLKVEWAHNDYSREIVGRCV
jgi:hypothetical protein